MKYFPLSTNLLLRSSDLFIIWHSLFFCENQTLHRWIIVKTAGRFYIISPRLEEILLHINILKATSTRYIKVLLNLLVTRIHRRRECERCSPNSLRPISYFWSILELCVLDLKTKVFCRKENQLHFPMNKGLTVTK